jgi:cobalt-zinc-cadmium efflux system membrane fusion protein
MRHVRSCLAAGVWLLVGCSRAPQKDGANSSARLLPGPSSRVVLPMDSPKLRQIRIAVAETAEVPVDEVVAPGKIDINPNRVSRVVLPVAGRISAVHVKLGDAVSQGQPLLTIESPEAEAANAACQQADAALTQTRAALLKAQADFDRVNDLYTHGAMAKKEVINTETALTQAKAALTEAEAGSQQARRRVSILGLVPCEPGQPVLVRAPVSGKVLDISVVPGEYRNDTSTPLMTIADLSTVWVTSDIPESSIRFIELGEKVQIELAANPGEVFHGRVARIADTVEPQTRTIKVQAELDNPHGKFRPEMFAKIRHTHGTRTLPMIPASAVVQTEAGPSAFVERAPGEFELVTLRTGDLRAGRIPVLEGLKAGDRVVIDGAVLLRGQ